MDNGYGYLPRGNSQYIHYIRDLCSDLHIFFAGMVSSAVTYIFRAGFRNGWKAITPHANLNR